FLSLSSSALLDRHSFPTRRSSDLAADILLFFQDTGFDLVSGKFPRGCRAGYAPSDYDHIIHLFSSPFFLTPFSVFFCPSIGIFYSFIPSFDFFLPLFFIDGWKENLIDLPVFLYILFIFPVSYCKSCQIGSAHCRSFHASWTVD